MRLLKLVLFNHYLFFLFFKFQQTRTMDEEEQFVNIDLNDDNICSVCKLETETGTLSFCHVCFELSIEGKKGFGAFFAEKGKQIYVEKSRVLYFSQSSQREISRLLLNTCAQTYSDVCLIRILNHNVASFPAVILASFTQRQPHLATLSLVSASKSFPCFAHPVNHFCRNIQIFSYQ